MTDAKAREAVGLRAVTASLYLFQHGGNDLATSDHFTGSAALTAGKITANLTPILSKLADFNDRYDDTADSKELCPGDVKGLLFTGFSDGEDTDLGLGKTDMGDNLTHLVLFVYVDKDVTFTGDIGNLDLNGVEAKKGWNYISANPDTGDCEIITDLSGYRWVSW